jgi:hypothetical protein
MEAPPYKIPERRNVNPFETLSPKHCISCYREPHAIIGIFIAIMHFQALCVAVVGFSGW